MVLVKEADRVRVGKVDMLGGGEPLGGSFDVGGDGVAKADTEVCEGRRSFGVCVCCLDGLAPGVGEVFLG